LAPQLYALRAVLCSSDGSVSIPAVADSRAASRAGKATTTGVLPAKPGRQGPKQAERSSALWESPIKDVLPVGAAARGVFPAYHRITESQNGRGWKGPLWVI